MNQLNFQEKLFQSERKRGKERPSDLASKLFLQWTTRSNIWRPPTDVFESSDLLVVRVEIGGMKSSDFHITLEDRTLKIYGERKDLIRKNSFQQMEIRFGSFATEVLLPVSVIEEDITAEYNAGFLIVVLPKMNPHHIELVDDESN